MGRVFFVSLTSYLPIQPTNFDEKKARPKSDQKVILKFDQTLQNDDWEIRLVKHMRNVAALFRQISNEMRL